MSEQSIWLIRTKQNKILGPVSKNKIQELLAKGALTPDDEICSGNGFWFWVKEQELVDQYVYGDVPQPFNPVSEATTVVAINGFAPDEPEYNDIPAPPPVVKVDPAPVQVKVGADDDEETLVPDQDDLEYPDPEDYKNITVEAVKIDVDFTPSSNKLSLVENESAEEEEIIMPEADDLEYPDFDAPEATDNDIDSVLEDEKNEPLKNVEDLEDEELTDDSPVILSEGETPPEVETTEEKITKKVKSKPVLQEMPKPTKKKKKKKKKAENTEEVQQLKKKNDKILLYLAVLVIFILLYGIYFYYTSILGKSIVNRGLNMLVPVANAQEVRVYQKKKSPLHGEISMLNTH
ncbi:hypothetical protein [Bacteriovorax sp. Seq25_V]|uniref:hypothetical protein n=1 Tax=Bacteriovorax sp. Seq25_V TaxID=1201288 RepID=UPI000389DE99|nr:hypothetical protein [Bacteriovorax sp. Seq25_V]EQC45435.1 hypothetical protein M900_2158 [Bacteriovorax sp. Seq25_V]